jgi:serine/threonine-protein kinase RCK2
MRGLNHPGIVKLLHFSESSDFYYLVLERTSLQGFGHQILRSDFATGSVRRRGAVPPNC